MGLDWVRRHRVTDVVLLVCVIGLATLTWVTSHIDGVSAWKACFAVSATMFLALAALTSHEPRAVAMRLALSGWLLAAPWLLVLADVPVTRWSYLIAGLLIVVLSTPCFRHRTADTDRLVLQPGLTRRPVDSPLPVSAPAVLLMSQHHADQS